VKLTLKSKLVAIAAITAVAMAATAILSQVAGRTVQEQLDDIQTRLVPRIELRPRLHHELEAMARSYQNAVAAEDAEMLDAAAPHRANIGRHLAGARAAVDPEPARLLPRAVDD
jgi:hypothetical protein